jgi:predicted aspartyl protease
MTQARRTVSPLFQILFLLASMGIVSALSPTALATEKRSLVLTHSESHRPFTDVLINGVGSSALIDTAATIPLIDDSYLDLEALGEDAPTIEATEARILGIGGQRFYPVARLPNLSAGGERWSDLRVAVNNESLFPINKSVLPISIFESRVVDFDFRNDRVYLYEGRPKRVRRAHQASVRYQDVNSLMFVPVKINGVRGRALIDTGADVSFINPQFAEQSKAKFDEDRTAILRGSDLTRNRASIYQVRRIAFAENEFNRVTVPVLETDLFTELGFGDEPMMIFGMDLLQHFRVQIDRGRQRIYFIRSTGDSRISASREVYSGPKDIAVR